MNKKLLLKMQEYLKQGDISDIELLELVNEELNKDDHDLFYVCVEDNKFEYSVYKDAVFTSPFKKDCERLEKLALEKYSRNQVEICNLSLNPIIGIK